MCQNLVHSGDASPLLVGGHRQVTSRISQHLPWHALVWRRHCWCVCWHTQASVTEHRKLALRCRRQVLRFAWILGFATKEALHWDMSTSLPAFH